jgi:putative flippase GtrA
MAVVCGFCVDFFIYATLVGLGVSVYLANAAGFCVGTVLNVILIRAFVFPDSRFRLGTDVPLTFVANGAMFGLGMGLLWLLVELASVNPYWAKLLTNGTTFVLNYVTRTVFFRRR